MVPKGLRIVDALVLRQWLAGLDAETAHDIEHAGCRISPMRSISTIRSPEPAATCQPRSRHWSGKLLDGGETPLPYCGEQLDHSGNGPVVSHLRQIAPCCRSDRSDARRSHGDTLSQSEIRV
jgi:hypothetical protein